MTTPAPQLETQHSKLEPLLPGFFGIQDHRANPGKILGRICLVAIELSRPPSANASPELTVPKPVRRNSILASQPLFVTALRREPGYLGKKQLKHAKNPKIPRSPSAERACADGGRAQAPSRSPLARVFATHLRSSVSSADPIGIPGIWRSPIAGALGILASHESTIAQFGVCRLADGHEPAHVP